MTTKHTAGPWQARSEYDRGSIVANIDVDTDGDLTCEPICDVDESSDRWEANARLIAEAPEMLEALKEAFNFLGGQDDAVEIRERLRIAIARAEGRS